jgi:acyl-CoA hydrolase
MELPGTRALILKESLEFKKPVHIGDTITVTGKIVSKSESVGLIEVGVSITVKGEITTQGSVHVRVRS